MACDSGDVHVYHSGRDVWLTHVNVTRPRTDATGVELIGGPYDGAVLVERRAEDCLWWLLMLRRAGYRVPPSTIASLEGEC